MTSFDVRLMEYLIAHDFSTSGEIAEEEGFPESYIQSRVEILEEFGLCYDAGDGRYQARIGEEELEDRRTLIRNLSYRTVIWKSEGKIDWTDGEDLRLLQQFEDTEQPTSLHSLDDNYSSLEDSKTLSKLSQMGLVQPVDVDKYSLTEKGKKSINYELRVYDVVKPVIPGHVSPIHFAADKILKLLDYFDPSTDEAVRDVERSTWQAERIFHEQIRSRSSIYLATLLSGFLLVAATEIGIISLTLQRIGLLFDIAGAVFVALGLFRGRRGIAIESEELGGRFAGTIPLQPESVRATTTSTLDGVFGTSLLVTGFILQFLAVSPN
jgi:hypothetical protein